jgi:hypothetical protein
MNKKIKKKSELEKMKRDEKKARGKQVVKGIL